MKPDKVDAMYWPVVFNFYTDPNELEDLNRLTFLCSIPHLIRYKEDTVKVLLGLSFGGNTGSCGP